MLPVPDRYIEMMESGTRKQQFVRLRIPVIDPTAADDATIIALDQETYYSDTSNLPYENVIDDTYTTFEPGRWSVIDPGLVLPETTDADPIVYTGSTLADISDENGTFDTDVGYRVTFGTQHSFPAVTLTFDTYYETHPDKVTVIGYRAGTIVQSVTAEIDSVELAVYPDNRQGFEQVDQLDILFVEMGGPYRRPRISKILFGYVYEPGNSDIVSLDMEWDSDPLSRWLPIEKLRFVLNNFDYVYSPDNPAGIWNDFEERIPISVQFGQQLAGIMTWEDVYDYDWAEINRRTWMEIYEGRAIWWMSLGDFYLDGAPKTRGRTAEFTAVGGASILDDTYYRGVWGPKTLYDLAVDVFRDSWLPQRDDGSDAWFVDEALKDFTTEAPIPIMTHGEALQLIANAARCVIYSDKERRLCITPMPVREYPDTLIDFHLAIEPPDTDLTKVLGGVYYESYTHLVDEEPQEAINTTYDVVEGESFIVEFNSPLMDVEVTLSDDSTYTVFANCVEIVPVTTGELTVVINGTGTERITHRTSAKVENARPTSAWADFKNELVTSAEWARTNAIWCRDYLVLRNTKTTEYAARPELEVFDGIKIQTLFTDALDVWIIKHTLSFNGAIRGSLITKAKE